MQACVSSRNYTANIVLFQHGGIHYSEHNDVTVTSCTVCSQEERTLIEHRNANSNESWEFNRERSTRNRREPQREAHACISSPVGLLSKFSPHSGGQNDCLLRRTGRTSRSDLTNCRAVESSLKAAERPGTTLSNRPAARPTMEGARYRN